MPADEVPIADTRNRGRAFAGIDRRPTGAPIRRPVQGAGQNRPTSTAPTERAPPASLPAHCRSELARDRARTRSGAHPARKRPNGQVAAYQGPPRSRQPSRASSLLQFPAWLNRIPENFSLYPLDHNKLCHRLGSPTDTPINPTRPNPRHVAISASQTAIATAIHKQLIHRLYTSYCGRNQIQ